MVSVTIFIWVSLHAEWGGVYKEYKEYWGRVCVRERGPETYG